MGAAVVHSAASSSLARYRLGQTRRVAHDLEILLAGSGAARITDLTAWVSQRSVRTWLGQGRLVRLHPGVIALGRRRDDWLVRAHAAVLYTNGVLSHSTALALWGVIAQGPTRPHVSVPPGRGLRSGPGLVVHRRTTDERPFDIAGLPVTSIDAALVDTWPLLNRRVAHPGSSLSSIGWNCKAVRSISTRLFPT